MEENDNGELIHIHYQGWDKTHDEWINKDSYRIAPINTVTSSSSEIDPIEITPTKSVVNDDHYLEKLGKRKFKLHLIYKVKLLFFSKKMRN